MKWKQIVMAAMCAGILTGCQQQEVISLSGDKEVETSAVQEENGISSEETDTVYVYVCGHVVSPGVYELDPDARIYDAIKKAGGVLEDAHDEALDQALLVTDGQTIYVPGIEEQTPQEAEQEEDGLVNINQADAAELMTLPGIGESKASVIIQYREEHGGFQSIEEIMDIPGIKQGVFDKIKNHIKV